MHLWDASRERDESLLTSEHTDIFSALERKLREGNAPPTLIDHAKRLRSNAARREIEILSKGALGRQEQERLEHAQVQLLTAAIGIQSEHAGEANSAARIFNSLRKELREQAEALDPHGVYN